MREEENEAEEECTNCLISKFPQHKSCERMDFSFAARGTEWHSHNHEIPEQTSGASFRPHLYDDDGSDARW